MTAQPTTFPPLGPPGYKEDMPAQPAQPAQSKSFMDIAVILLPFICIESVHEAWCDGYGSMENSHDFSWDGDDSEGHCTDTKHNIPRWVAFKGNNHELGIGTIFMGVVGKPFSKVQVVIGIFQFFVGCSLIRYLWAIGWGVMVFLKGMASSQAGPQAAQGAQGAEGQQDKAYDLGPAAQPNPFEMGGGRF